MLKKTVKTLLHGLLLGTFAAAWAKVDINTAGVEEFTQLAGIGASKAQAIVEYREANGPFARVDDLVNVKGIGEKTLEKIRDELSVGGTKAADKGAGKPAEGKGSKDAAGKPAQDNQPGTGQVKDVKAGEAGTAEGKPEKAGKAGKEGKDGKKAADKGKS